MNDFHDPLKELSEDNIYNDALIIDSPSELISSSAEAYSAICSAWNNDAFRSAVASVSRIHESIQPAITSSLCTAAISSVAVQMGRIADTVRPIKEMCATAGVYAAAEKLQESQICSVECISSIAESVQARIALSDKVMSARNLALEAALPIPFEAVSAAQVAFSMVQDSIPTFDMNPLTSFLVENASAGSRIAALVDSFNERIGNLVCSLAARIQEIYDHMQSMAAFLFHALYSAWKKRPRRIRLPGINETIRAAVLACIGPSPPASFLEIFIRIRHTYLLRRWQISDDSDDPNHSILLIYSV